MSDELEVLFDRHFGDVFRYLSRRVGVHVAEDLAAETFAIAIQQQGSYDPSRGPLRPWLFGIATNLVRQHARSEEVHLRALARLRQELSTRPMMVEEEAAHRHRAVKAVSGPAQTPSRLARSRDHAMGRLVRMGADMRRGSHFVRDFFDASPSPSPEAQARVRAKVETLLNEHHDLIVKKTRRLQHRNSLMAGAGVAVLIAAAGTGIAAATGTFQSQANQALTSATTAVTSPNALSPSTSAAPPSPGGSATASPTTTIALTPETTIGGTAVIPSSEQEVWDGPGPGTTGLQVWTANEATGQICVTVVTGAPGESTFPGKGSAEPGLDCLSPQDLNPANAPVSTIYGYFWRSRDGNPYSVYVGRSDSSTKIEVISPQFTDATIRVKSGWFAYYLPYSATSTGYELKGFSADGSLVGVEHVAGVRPDTP